MRRRAEATPSYRGGKGYRRRRTHSRWFPARPGGGGIAFVYSKDGRSTSRLPRLQRLREEMVELGGRRGFRHMLVKPSLPRLALVLRKGVPRKRYETTSTQQLVLTKCSCDLVPAHARQSDIAEHDLGLELASFAQSLGAVMRDLDDVATELQETTQRKGP